MRIAHRAAPAARRRWPSSSSCTSLGEMSWRTGPLGFGDITQLAQRLSGLTSLNSLLQVTESHSSGRSVVLWAQFLKCFFWSIAHSWHPFILRAFNTTWNWHPTARRIRNKLRLQTWSRLTNSPRGSLALDDSSLEKKNRAVKKCPHNDLPLHILVALICLVPDSDSLGTNMFRGELVSTHTKWWW